MKIGNSADKPAATGTTGTPTAATEHTHHGKHTHGAGQAESTDASAKVELSSTASTLLSGGTSSEFDAQKVAQISQAISSGTYQVNPEAIADKLIGNAQELLTKVKS